MPVTYAHGLEVAAAVTTAAAGAVALRRGPRRPGLAVGVLVLLLALAAHATFEARADSLARLPRAGQTGLLHLVPRLGHHGPDPPTARFALHATRALVAAVLQRVPRSATYATVPASPAFRRRAVNFRVRYALAPRVQVPLSEHPDWVLVWGGAPTAAGVHGRHAWRFGGDWLVQQ